MMKHNTSGSQSLLLHVPVRLYYASVFRRDEVERRVRTTGVFSVQHEIE